MTNYDRIKAMSVEEMAVLIDNAEEELLTPPCSPRYCEGYGDGVNCSKENREKHCHKATINWLESEVQDDE